MQLYHFNCKAGSKRNCENYYSSTSLSRPPLCEYLDNPNNGFWVAEAADRELSRVVGMVAVIGRRETEEGEHRNNLNGGMRTGSSADGSADSGKMSHLAVAFPCRRRKVGSQLTQRALDFCKERGFARLVLDVSSPQTGAVSLLRKSGFIQTSTHNDTHANCWISKLARIGVTRMEKILWKTQRLLPTWTVQHIIIPITWCKATSW